MIKSLPEKPSIEFYKKQSKRLLKQTREDKPQTTLTEVQLSIAREHGFPSWPKFISKIEELSLDFKGRVDLFIRTACTKNLNRAKQLLKDNPKIAEANFLTACLVGNLDLVKSLYQADPSLITKTQGPKECEAIVYASLSCFFHNGPAAEDQLTEVAQFLLEHGANPNATYKYGVEPEADARLTVLFTAVWEAKNVKLTKILLEAGANPNDGESLYHSTENDDHQCMKLLIKHGAKEKSTNALIRKLDFDDLEGVEILLKAGADPNERHQIYFGCKGQTALHKVVMSARTPEFMKLLLKYKGDPTLVDKQNMSAYRLAYRFGRQDIVNCLEEAGYHEKPDVKDQFLHHCMQGDEFSAKSILSKHPEVLNSLKVEDKELFAHACFQNRVDAAKLMLQFNFDINIKMGWGTSIHHAAWWGHAETMKFLIDAGADLESLNAYGGNLWSSVFHGYHNAAKEHQPVFRGQPDYYNAIKYIFESGIPVPEWMFDIEDDKITRLLSVK